MPVEVTPRTALSNFVRVRCEFFGQFRRLVRTKIRPSSIIPYGRKFWRGIYFGGLAVLRAIRQYFIRQKLHSVISHYCEIIVCVLAAAKFASLIAGMEFTIESCVRGYRFSKEFCTPNATNVIQTTCTQSL